MKLCARCKEYKSYSDFRKDKRYLDGYGSWCKQCHKEYSREWEHNPKRRKYAKEWKRSARLDDQYRTKDNALINACRKKDPLILEKKKVWGAMRRSRINQSKEHFSVQEWIAVCDLYDNTCLACRKKVKLTPDHVIPIVRGGDDSIDNIQPLCGSCNSSKHTKIIDYRWEVT